MTLEDRSAVTDRMRLTPRQCREVWYGMVWYGWYGMVWYGMAWHGMVWYGMVW